MKYQFSISVHHKQFKDGKASISKEIDAESYEDACFQGRRIMFVDIPELAEHGIIPFSATVPGRFELELKSED